MFLCATLVPASVVVAPWRHVKLSNTYRRHEQSRRAMHRRADARHHGSDEDPSRLIGECLDAAVRPAREGVCLCRVLIPCAVVGKGINSTYDIRCEN